MPTATDGTPARAAAAKASGGMSPITTSAPLAPQEVRFPGHAPIECRMEACRLAGGLLFVEPQAVDLHDAGVRFERLHIDRRGMGIADRREEPPRRGGPNDDARVRLPCQQCSNELDRARRVAEAVAGDVEENLHCRL